ncbi:GNAT family N-acetyltransferase [Actinopolymorpha sp. B17G11]|uniref:GNAT family N-acetyltransferase n=1 Tax=unclassified Actinopolymorpha TaxID=2627063 RepID=UPI0032D9A0DF
MRTALDGDREPMHRVGQLGFAARSSAYDEEADRAGVPLDRRLVATDGGEIVGRLSVWELGQWFGGRRVPMGGVGGVAVDPAYRGRGVASALIRRALGQMRERGEVLSTLFPMNHTLYRRHGWEVAGSYPEHKLDLRALIALPRPARPTSTRRVEERDLPALRELHEEVSRDEPGNLWHGPDFAARRLLGGKPVDQDAYVAERDGGLVGLVIVERGDAADDRGFFTLTIRQLVAVDLDAELTLLRLLGAFHPVAEVAELIAPHSFALSMLVGERDLRPAGWGWCWMSRLVDAPGAIAARGYDDSVDVEVHLALTDDTAPWNSGAHVLRVKDGQAILEPGGRGEVKLGVGQLASLYTGWANPRRLSRVGLVAGATEADLRALDRAFAGRTPWMRDFF